jgi:tRNA C32,U32 (ribose-2'-O)-methylase TrmJ
LYEITRSVPIHAAPGVLPPTPDAGDDVPSWNEYFQLDRLVDSVMRESGFLRPGKSAPAPAVIRNLFRRLPLSGHEMRILLALFGRLDRTLLRRRQPDSKGCHENDR